MFSRIIFLKEVILSILGGLKYYETCLSASTLKKLALLFCTYQLRILLRQSPILPTASLEEMLKGTLQRLQGLVTAVGQQLTTSQECVIIMPYPFVRDNCFIISQISLRTNSGTTQTQPHNSWCRWEAAGDSTKPGTE